MKAIGLLKYFKTKKGTTYKMMCKVSEAIAELEEIKKEDEYIKQKMKESLSMGNRAQSLAFVEVYQIINNRTTK